MSPQPPRPEPPPECVPADGPEPEPTPRIHRVYYDEQERHWYRVDTGQAQTDLPPIEDATDFIEREMPTPPELISGVLHQGCKLALGGASKTFKTWSLIDLALSVSHGQPWLGFNTARARVCYLNFELPPWALQQRLVAVAKAKSVQIDNARLRLWNLRGHAACYKDLIPKLAAELSGADFGLLILDPIYRLYGTADENSARDMAALMNGFENLIQQTRAAIAFANHFSKGNQSGKESIDRISGSGVFARDPDAILTFTRHNEDSAFSVESTLRNCPPVSPFVVRWQRPLMRRDGNLDPAKLRKTVGRSKSFTVEMILKCLGKREAQTGEWQKLCEKGGITRQTFYRLFKDAKASGAVALTQENKWKVSQVP